MDAVVARLSYTKVLDHRKHPVRGLWRRHDQFLARITVQNDMGRSRLVWVPLVAKASAQAWGESRTLLVERTENRLRLVCGSVEHEFRPRPLSEPLQKFSFHVHRVIARPFDNSVTP